MYEALCKLFGLCQKKESDDSASLLSLETLATKKKVGIVQFFFRVDVCVQSIALESHVGML